jgi:hypothetical protein
MLCDGIESPAIPTDTATANKMKWEVVGSSTYRLEKERQGRTGSSFVQWRTAGTEAIVRKNGRWKF